MKFDNKKRILSPFFILLLFSTLVLAQSDKENDDDAASGFSSLDDKFGNVQNFEDVETVNNEDEDDQKQSDEITEEELVYLNATDVDIKDMIKQISKATGTNFLLDDKIRGKITIISEKPMTKEMAYQAFLSALEVMGYTTVKTPGGLLKIVQTKSAINEPLDIYYDKAPNTDRFITRILQVKNISANEISSVIKTLVSKEGNLFAYPATNSLIITDSGSNIERIMKIVRELDQVGPREVIEIIPIQNADAADITEKVLQLFEQDDQPRRRTTRRRRRSKSTPELEDSPAVSKVISDDRTNSIIVLGSKGAIVKIKALIRRLDSPIQGIDGTIHVYYLKHANSKEIAEVLSSLVSNASTKGSASKGKKSDANSGAVQLEGGVKVTADEGTNSLVITASPKDYQILIDKVITKLDIPRRQIFLEAVIMELRVRKEKTFGINGNFGNIFNINGKDMTTFGALLPTFPASITSIASASGGIAGGSFSSDSIDFSLGDGSSLSIPAVSTIIQALQRDTDANVLSTPSILTLDNEEAQIQVGQEVPTPSGTTVSSGVTTFNVTREDTGIILKVTPQISESDTVRLQILQEVTDVVASDPSLGPTLNKSAVQTTVVAHDQQTIVIGGLMEDRQTASVGKVPLLGDIPILGNLFKTKNKDMRKSNLVVFITPYIIKDRSDYLRVLKKKIEERNQFIEYNYGKSQRKKIRQAIQRHSAELLEYKTAVNPNFMNPAVKIESSERVNETPEKK